MNSTGFQNEEAAGFECRRCGVCCRWPGSVILTDADIAALAAALDLTEDEFIAEYTGLARNRRALTLREQDDGACVLLEDSRCRVYEARPAQCRDFPHKWRVEEGCPALDALKKGAD